MPPSKSEYDYKYYHPVYVFMDKFVFEQYSVTDDEYGNPCLVMKLEAVSRGYRILDYALLSQTSLYHREVFMLWVELENNMDWFKLMFYEYSRKAYGLNTRFTNYEDLIESSWR